MDTDFKFPSSSGPLFAVSPERVNIQRSSQIYDESPTHSRESSVHEKVQAFNSLAFQGKQLERKTNDAALKRAMLGREEAESEMRRYREEARALRRSVEEGKERERRVGERLENVMENYGRAKETHAHTQALWEKEIRRARKESFKSQSSLVKLQEELKSARSSLKTLQAELDTEKERSMKREQEAFAARYQLVGVQEEFEQMVEKIKLVEQERDALRAVAKNEEVARIAAEGQIPLPVSHDDDEFASPRKSRASLSPDMVTRSAASEEEIDDIRMRLEWSQHLASRAFEQVEFLELESKLHTSAKPELRKSTIFVPSEGVFRTVDPEVEESPWISPAKKHLPMPEPDRTFARTPSCEPPALAIPPPHIDNTRASLASLFEVPASPSVASSPIQESSPTQTISSPSTESTLTQNIVQFHTISTTTRIPLADAPEFHTISTTTRVPLADAPDLNSLPQSLDPALSPTMSREEALAQIRERRGRARSLAQGTMTPRKQMVEGAGVRRDISAPAVRSGGVRGRLGMKS